MEKKSCKCAETIKQLKQDRDRLAEENSNILTVTSSHKQLNGDLRKELDQVKEDNKKSMNLTPEESANSITRIILNGIKL